MSQELIMDVLGWMGAGCVLVAYIMVSLKRWAPDRIIYQALNILGSICLAINTGYHGAIPSVIVNLIWIGVAIFAVMKFHAKS